MRTPSRMRFARRFSLLAAVCLWAVWICVTSPTSASDVFSKTAPQDWREAAKSVLAAHAQVVPTCSPWYVAGPFGHADFATPFPPQADPDNWSPEQTFRGRSNRELCWQETKIPEAADFDLRRLCPDYQRDGTFYLARTITVDRDCVHATAMRGMSGLAVWINGRQLVDRGPGDGWLGGGWEPKEALLVPLDAGVNRLLVKVDGLHKNKAWIFRHAKPQPDELRYTLSMTLRRTYPAAGPPLDWLRRDGLDLLELWPRQRRDAEFNQRLDEATSAALGGTDAWLNFLGASDVSRADLAQAAGETADIRRRLETGKEPLQVYFAANTASRRLENLPQAQVIQNWLALDELSLQSPMDDTVRAAIAATLDRGDDLLEDFGPRFHPPRGSNVTRQWRNRFGVLRSRLESLSASPDDAAPLRALYVNTHAAVRELVFANPLLRFEKLVFYKRYSPRTMNIHRHQFPSARYMDWPARPGGDLYVLPELRPDAKPTPLLRGRLGPGIIRGYDLSYDAGRIVFGFWNADVKRSAPKVRFEYDCYVTEGHANLYELDVRHGKVRQLTTEAWHDVDPCYLPNGRIAFASERCGHNAQCDPNPWSEPMVNLYTVAGGGGDPRRLTSHKDNDNFARVLQDGRVSYTRWEYHERGGLLRTQSLWVSRPDGTQEDALFKTHLDLPYALEEARAVPGGTSIAAVATGHHTNAAGAIVRIDLKRGVSSVEDMQIVTPGVSEFEGGLAGVPVPQGGVGGYGYYSTPWPLSEKYFLVAYNPGRYPAADADPDKAVPWGHYLSGVPGVDMARAEGFGLYVIDVYGNRELIYRDPEISCLSPIPMVPRPMPPILPDAVDPQSDHATLLVTDVQQGLDLPDGTIKHIRISEAMPWPYTKQGAGRYPREFDYTMKRTIGIVPVESDGSAHFNVPAGVGLYFQALDADLIEVRRMRSLLSFQPGERRSCTGCHETQTAAPRSAVVLAAGRAPSTPEPPPWGDHRPISFLRDVQPVLDKHCVSCHSGLKPAADVDLFPGLTGPAHDRAHCTSFDALTQYVPRSHVPFAEEKGPVKFDVTRPYQFGSSKSKLVALLKQGHEKVELTRGEWLTLLTWIDNNGLYSGSFVSVHDWGLWGYRPQTADMRAVRTIQQRRCIGCHADADLANPGWIDPRDPKASLFLTAPLATKAGGLGKCRPSVFQSTDDPDYKALLNETQKIWHRMRQDPTPGMKELAAAEIPFDELPDEDD